MSSPDYCENIRADMALYLYGELSSEAEERVEAHASQCAACQQELERWKAMFAALDRGELEPSAAALGESRRRLRQTLQEAAQERRSWWDRVLPGMASWRPYGAVAALTVGFFGAKLISPPGWRWQTEAETGPVTTNVRYVDADPSGNVRLTLDETRQRQIEGSLNDESIRRLLLNAAQDAADPGLRGDTIDVLKASSDAADVRSALLAALRMDENPAVRMKALEGLRPYSGDAEVRRALSQALLYDSHAGVRTQAIDILTQNQQEDVVGVLQELVRSEDNDYIRQRSQNALRAMKASLGTF